MNYFQRFFGHLKTILVHKYWVLKYCIDFDIGWRGIIHDMSKFSPVEFFEGVRYYTGTRSPIDVCKEKIGYSKAWLHHKGRNKHHYEYWQDNFDKGTDHLLMPFPCALEMLADYLGAGRAYMKNDFSYQKEYEWWLKKKQSAKAMHPGIARFIDTCLHSFAVDNNTNFLSNIGFAQYVYKTSCLNLKR